jgi:hypothetical protein
LYGTLKWDLGSTDIVVWDPIQLCQRTPGPISMFHTTMSVDSRSHFNVPYNYVSGLQVPFQCPIQPCQWTPGAISMSHTIMSVDSRCHFNVPYNHVSGLQVPFQCPIQPCQWTPGAISMSHSGTWSPLTWLYGTLKWDQGSTDMVVWDIEMAPGVH